MRHSALHCHAGSFDRHVKKESGRFSPPSPPRDLGGGCAEARWPWWEAHRPRREARWPRRGHCP